MMTMPLALLLLVAAPETVSQREMHRYVSAVSFWDGQCRFWTGDVRMNARDYKRDLQERFDHKFGIVIYRKADVPAKCAARAEKLARQAGFREVSVEIGAIDLGPPR